MSCNVIMLEKIRLGMKYIFSIPKTILFNFRIFPFLKAIKLPIFITNSVNCKDVYRGCIEIQGKTKMFMIFIGVGGSKAIESKKGMIHISKKQNSKIIFKGNAKFSEGIVLYVNKGNLTIGNNFSSNKNCFIASDNNMKFGDDILLGWNVNIRDSDGHEIIYNTPNAKIKDSKVSIGNHVWICANTDILKGTKIGDDCVVAYRSCVLGLETFSNSLIGGYPAKILRNDINWKK